MSGNPGDNPDLALSTDVDMAGQPPPDLAGQPPRDLAHASGPDLAMKPGPGSVGPTGGTVTRLFFGIHGDTRPMDCTTYTAPYGYPASIIQGIFKAHAQAQVQFALDLGDHMFVCNGSSTMANNEMGYYMSASQLLTRTTFMVMGNHECESSYCLPGSSDVNYHAFTQALAPISSLPYYSFNVQTSAGLATFVVIADSAWDATQQSWLNSTLTTADQKAKYTIIARHHPIDFTGLQAPAEWTIIQSHKYSLMLTGHTHEYKHDTYLDHSGRTLRIGNGGAPLQPGAYNGYGTVTQGTDDNLYVNVYDMNGQLQDAWWVPPQ
jgi:hypothetical protein